ncbi:MAG TPA: hypothetical protein PKZ26_09900 [Anaerolineaceae bacterium]|nr:hypothetical protein [Candidatus Cloacimonadota bacterium]NMC17681.1 hypothetical protein [Chloroflexota bacterium]HNS07863.1 hypothetical protein [Anaerolineaceae bacterium]HOE03384.1 hypothetical protein [Anaerolineaceae bacterium]HOQ68819.1 hypothetical protein [Anaerolineaceae bacterium]
MKASKVAIILSLCLWVLTACNGGEQAGLNQETGVFPKTDWSTIPEQLPASLKGYELYSWQQGKTRVYTLTTGTNRTKSFAEITAAENIWEGDYLKISVASLEELKKLLSRLPAETQVFWGGIDLSGQVEEGTLYFSYPADEELKEILQYSQELGLKLHTIHEQQEDEP